MATMTGLRRRTAGERAYDRSLADHERDEIEAAERELLNLIEQWAIRHDGDRKAIDGYIHDFLSDYFFERRHQADQMELGW